MQRKPYVICAICVLLAAASLRLMYPDWDAGLGAHPDERYIVGVAEAIRWPGQLNPYVSAPDYAYGHLLPYVLALARAVIGGLDALLLSRLIAGMLDTVTVAVTMRLGREVFGPPIGLLAAALLSFTVLHVQHAHFYTPDVVLGLTVAVTLFFGVRTSRTGSDRDAALAGVCAGLAIGTKASAALVLPALWVATGGPREDGLAVWRRRRWCCVAALTAYGLTNPYAVANPWTTWRNVSAQSAVLSGAIVVPYTRQYAGTIPYLYPWIQQMRWGMGWGLAVVCSCGSACMVWRAIKQPLPRQEWVLLAWIAPYSAFFGALHAKFPRYWLPVVPIALLYGCWTVACLARRNRWAAMAVTTLVLSEAVFRCASLLTMYTLPHPWIVASSWIAGNVPSGARIAVEEWDHPLPTDAGQYTVYSLPVVGPVDPARWAEVEERLLDAEYVIVASRRGLVAAARATAEEPAAVQYYRGLFDGSSGYRPVACFERLPGVGALKLTDDVLSNLSISTPDVCLQSERERISLNVGWLDESFVVYDHPRVIIFRRVQ
ncbi:MAG: glycosyltransferase family 39 protein [Chloroflexi bacterium]|nr:glycosyltransferase family 39 protein [Chloroflexota bacterium]